MASGKKQKQQTSVCALQVFMGLSCSFGPCIEHKADKRRGMVGISSVVV